MDTGQLQVRVERMNESNARVLVDTLMIIINKETRFRFWLLSLEFHESRPVTSFNFALPLRVP